MTLTLLLAACTTPADAPVDPPDTVDSVAIERVGDAVLPSLSLSHERGLYDAAFELSVDGGDQVLVTWDGTDPRTSDTALTLDTPTSLQIDPTLDLAGWTAPAVLLRASVRDASGVVTAPETHTYLFPGHVADLSPDNERPGPGWPAPYQTNNDGDEHNAIDYGMDPQITGSDAYGDLIEPALRALPTLSVVTELDHLFDDETGIYENAMEHGRDWERPTSVELLDPDGQVTQQFQIDAGIRIRGGWSRHSSCPKHALRFHFRSDYGDAKLEYPLFGDQGADSFDTVDLRTAQNYSWSFKGSAGAENTFVRDVFSRDVQRDMGVPHTRSEYYHLYLNGVYWGLYQTQERAEASFGATYMGGDKDDWDVVKVNGDDPRGRVIEATDGTLDAWERVWEIAEFGLSGDGAYAEVTELIDVDNLIDYMSVIFYTGNFDAPTGAFTRNSGPNNFFALYNRESPGAGFVFFAHDAEHSLHPLPWGPGIGLYEDRVNLGTRDDSYRMSVSGFQDFHPQWLHHRLTDNADYRARFNERVHEHFFGDGALSTANNLARVQARVAEIELAVVAESARWGDTKVSTPRTRADDWSPAIERLVNDWIPYRNDVVLAQLEHAGLYAP